MALVKDKVALVTGGASGIGKACAERLAQEGAAVVVTDVQVKAGEAVVAGIVAAGGQAVFLKHDVSSEDEWISVIADVRRRHGRLDILVNNAGIGVGGLVTDMTLELWRKQQSINVEGVFLGVKHSLPLMRDGGGQGSIINISSVAGLKGAAGMSGYCATKGAVRLFTKSVALECAAAGDGIRCNSVHPGIIDTPIWDTISDTTPLPSHAGANRIDLDALTAMASPIARPGAPKEIADGVLYLASDMSSYVTGTELVIDGGFVTR